jgi:hypothetical protein
LFYIDFIGEAYSLVCNCWGDGLMRKDKIQ